MTYREALQNGYRDAERTYQRGYVSRKCNPDEQIVQEAGGSKKGKLYVLLPNRASTRYCFRQYLRKED